MNRPYAIVWRTLSRMVLTLGALFGTLWLVRTAPYQARVPEPLEAGETRAERAAPTPAIAEHDILSWEGLPMRSERFDVNNCKAALWDPWVLGLCSGPDCQVLLRDGDFTRGMLVWGEGPPVTPSAASVGSVGSAPKPFLASLPVAPDVPAVGAPPADGEAPLPSGAPFETLHTAITQCRDDGTGSVTHLWMHTDPQHNVAPPDGPRTLPLVDGATPHGTFRSGEWRIQVDAVEDPVAAVLNMERELYGRGWRAVPGTEQPGAPQDARILRNGERIAMLTQREIDNATFLITVHSEAAPTTALPTPGERR